MVFIFLLLIPITFYLCLVKLFGMKLWLMHHKGFQVEYQFRNNCIPLSYLMLWRSTVLTSLVDLNHNKCLPLLIYLILLRICQKYILILTSTIKNKVWKNMTKLSLFARKNNLKSMVLLGILPLNYTKISSIVQIRRLIHQACIVGSLCFSQ